MDQYIDTLSQEFQSKANVQIAKEQKEYMRGMFEYYGLKAPVRKELQKPFLVRSYLPDKSNLKEILKNLWAKPQRGYQYFAMELCSKYTKKFDREDIELMEFMVVQKSWWDTVDSIASNLMGPYFKKFPEQRDSYIDKWLASDNMWLQRCCLLFQLKYKQNLDTALLTKVIHKLNGSKEFFINKAIGWILRSHAKQDANWVIDFVATHDLSNLSEREALKHIK